VFYVKGGYQNLFGLLPTDPDSAVQGWVGDGEHPGWFDCSAISFQARPHLTKGSARTQELSSGQFSLTGFEMSVKVL